MCWELHRCATCSHLYNKCHPTSVTYHLDHPTRYWLRLGVLCSHFGISGFQTPPNIMQMPHRWLVSLSYRVIFRQDPIPRESMHTASHKLKHVHGAIYMSDEAMQAGTQPKTTTSNPSMGDHDRQAYSAGLEATYQKTLSREQSTGVCSFTTMLCVALLHHSYFTTP